MAIAKLSDLASTKCWNLENSDVRLGIETATGFIRSLVFKKQKVDLFAQLRQGIPGYIGGLRIFDERDAKWYEDLKTPFILRQAKVGKNEVSFVKLYKGAPFKLTVTLRMEKDAFHWEVEAVKNNAKVKDRSLRVYFTMPLIASWDVWAPCVGGERFGGFDGMTPFEFMYTQVPSVSEYEIILPMCSHFNRQLDVGYTVINPIDERVPASKFQFSNGERCFNWGSMAKKMQEAPVLETVNYYIGLVGNRPMRTKVMMFFHEGCYRPGLGKIFNKYKKFFVPKNDRMYEHEGIFGGCLATWNPPPVAEVVEKMIKTYEFHGHFEYYCDYIQPGDTWRSVIVYEALFQKWGRKKDAREVRDWVHSHTDQEIMAEIEGKRPEDFSPQEAHERVWTTRKKLQGMIDELVAAGVSPFWYFNYTDGFRPEVERRWPDSIARDEDGAIQPSGWFMCHNMNSDPKGSFGKFQIESARKILKDYPHIAGFFLDCFRHYEIDFAHDDGITVVNNKPAYSMNFSYDDAEAVIEKMLLRADKCTFANKPRTIRMMRYVDGMMLEGNGDAFEEKFFWSGMAKPIVFLWTTNENSDDENCRRSVLHGCFPKASDDEPGLGRRKKYMALYEAMRRRVYCFEPDPMRVPKGCRGKLFTQGKDYIAGIVNLNVDEGQSLTYAKPPHAMFRVQRGCDVTKVGLMLPGRKDWKFVDFKFNGTFVAVPLEGFTNCAVVKLFVTGHSGKKIGPQKFSGTVDYCQDPDSSFMDISSR